jgi:ABC-type transporter Mla subunit MlaD
MSQKANYFKIGLFVIFGSALCVVGLIVFGMGAYLQKGVLIETYFDESVQGLEVGSSVKYRGVRVGSVESIKLVSEVYDQFIPENMPEGFSRYVYVLMRMDKEAFQERSTEIDQELLDKRVGQGMRIRLTQQGITGTAYLETDFFPPEQHAPLNITWNPAFLYLPSAPSLIKGVSNSVENVSRKIENVDIESIAENLNNMLAVVTHEADSSRSHTLGERLKLLLDNLNSVSASLDKITSDPALRSIVENTATTIESAGELVEIMKDQIKTLVSDFGESSRNFKEISEEVHTLFKQGHLQSGLEDFSSSMGNLKEASGMAPEVMNRLNTSLKQISNLVNRQGTQIEAILENLEQIARNLNEITQDARKNPGGLLLSPPPPRRREN